MLKIKYINRYIILNINVHWISNDIIITSWSCWCLDFIAVELAAFVRSNCCTASTSVAIFRVCRSHGAILCKYYTQNLLNQNKEVRTSCIWSSLGRGTTSRATAVMTNNAAKMKSRDILKKKVIIPSDFLILQKMRQWTLLNWLLSWYWSKTSPSGWGCHLLCEWVAIMQMQKTCATGKAEWFVTWYTFPHEINLLIIVANSY